MYAVIKTGGKQYTVKKGDVIRVERLKLDQDNHVEFKEVLLVSDGSKTHVGEPAVGGYTVTGKFLREVKGEKINSLKYKPTQYKRFGHRQGYFEIEIGGIHHHSEKKSESKKEVTHGT